MDTINGVFGVRQRDTIADAMSAALPGELLYALNDNAAVLKAKTGGGFLTIGGPVISVRSRGAIGNGIADDAIAVQAADTLAALVGGAVYFPTGTYILGSEVKISSGVTWFGDGKFQSILKSPVRVANTGVFMVHATNAKNWAIRDLGFDGNVANYPNEATTIPRVEPLINPALSFPAITAIRADLSTSTGAADAGANISVLNCHFTNITWFSVRLADPSGTDSWKHVKIRGNTFYHGAYGGKNIAVVGSSGTYAEYVDVSDNHTEKNGPTKYLKPGMVGMNGSTDGIEIYKCRYVTCKGNIVKYAAGCGLRLEYCEYGEASGNIVLESGQDGITCYNSGRNLVVTGNIVRRWGRIPQFQSLRKYPTVSDPSYICRETFLSGTVNLPANPSTDSRFVLNPYYLQGVSEDTVPVYSTSGYAVDATAYAGNPAAVPPTGYNTANAQGLYPFRGFAGIAVVQLTEKVYIANNIIEGDTTQTGGKYNYASDYCITTVHNSNDPQTYNSPIQLGPNQLSGWIYGAVYQPGFVDPINRRGRIEGVRLFTDQYGFQSVSATNVGIPVELPPSQYENNIHAASIPCLTLTAGGYLTSVAAQRPALGTSAFGIYIFCRFNSALSASAKYLLDMGLGGTATVGCRVNVRNNEINWSMTDGTSNFQVRYQNISDWGVGDNKVLLLYVGRDADGTLRMIVNGDEMTGAGPSPIVNMNNGLAIGINADMNAGPASSNLPVDIYRLVIWGQSFTRSEFMVRTNEKRLIRNGDTLLMDLDPKGYGRRYKDNANLANYFTATASNVTPSDPNLITKSSESAITASTTQTQGQRPLTQDINIISVCANANDTVTLPPAADGMEVYIRNNGAQTLKIFPASGDAINGAAANASVTLAAGASVRYSTADSTNWYS